MISVVVVSCNEAKKLDGCLKSVEDLAKEIIVIDLESKDNVEEIAHKYKAKLIMHEKVSHVELVRNLAISMTSYNWVLILDPDERVSLGLKRYLLDFTKQEKYMALNIARKNIFFGRWISHTNFWPDRQIRFFKKQNIDWPTKIHAYPKVNGLIEELKADPNLSIEHYGYDKWSEFFDRQKRYSDVEAKYLFDSGKRFNLLDLFWKPLREILVRLIKYQGYLDGYYGFGLILGLVWYQIIIQLKLLRLQQK